MTTFSPEEAKKAMDKFILDQVFISVNHQGWDTQRYPFIGMFLNMFFEGVTLAMYGYYITRRAKHASLEQIALFSAVLLTTFTSLMVLMRDYHTFVLRYSMPDALLNFHWSSKIDSAIAGPIYLFSNIFYARRLFPFFRNNIWVQIAAYAGITISFGLSVGTSITLIFMPKITVGFFDPELLKQVEVMTEYLYHWYTVFTVSSTMSPLVEAAIAFATIYKLQRDQKRAVFKNTSALLTHIAVVMMSSMIVPTIAFFTTLGLFTHNKDFKKSQCISHYIQKLVLIWLLTLFADRDELRRKRKVEADLAAISIQLDTIQITSESQRFAVGWNRRLLDSMSQETKVKDTTSTEETKVTEDEWLGEKVGREREESQERIDEVASHGLH